MHAVFIHKYGGVEALTHEATTIPRPGEDEVLVKISAIGVNFHDIYTRSGLYPTPLPFIIGKEAAGVVQKIGSRVTKFKVGERVGSASLNGGYAEFVCVREKELVPIPRVIDDKVACAVLLQGMTAHYLTQSTFQIKKRNTVLIHAAAGGIGGLLTQVARNMGAYVYGTASTEEKANITKKLGAQEVINYTKQDFEKEIMRSTKGKGVHVVYDSVGKDTYAKSLNCLSICGYLVLFGQSSGKVPPVDPLDLSKKSLFLTRPKLFDYILTHDALLDRAKEVFGWIMSGRLKVRIAKIYSLKDAAKAHKDLESRKYSGKLLLIP